MPPDNTVTSKAVLESMLLYRQHRRDALERLEASECDLAEYVIESLSHIHQELARLGGSVRDQRRVYRLIAELVLVAIDACRRTARSQTSENTAALSVDDADGH